MGISLGGVAALPSAGALMSGHQSDSSSAGFSPGRKAARRRGPPSPPPRARHDRSGPTQNGDTLGKQHRGQALASGHGQLVGMAEGLEDLD